MQEIVRGFLAWFKKSILKMDSAASSGLSTGSETSPVADNDDVQLRDPSGAEKRIVTSPKIVDYLRKKIDEEMSPALDLELDQQDEQEHQGDSDVSTADVLTTDVLTTAGSATNTRELGGWLTKLGEEEPENFAAVMLLRNLAKEKEWHLQPQDDTTGTASAFNYHWLTVAMKEYLSEYHLMPRPWKSITVFIDIY